jgi:hypothetical protein
MKRCLILLLLIAAVAVAGDQVPFVATFTSSVPGGILPSCTAPFTVPIGLVGKGQGTHMGQFTETQSHCLNPATFEFASGQFTFTGANGDTVFGTYSGKVVPTSATAGSIYGVFVITGGTGRFTGASGGGAATGTLDFVSGEANDLLLKGTISRPNS